jgi:superfamily II DNA or RNA helicase
MLKNPLSQQARTIRAIPETVKVMMESATPYQRVIDGTTMLEAFSAVTNYNTLPATFESSERLVGMIAYPKSPDEYSPSACGRLREALEPYTVELKNVHFKHKAITKCIDIYFKTPAERAAYNQLVNDLIANLRKRRHNGEIRPIDKLVMLQKMQQGAELLRAPHMADRAVANLTTKAIVIASNYVETLRSCYRELVHTHKIDPERIAFIVGGQSVEQRQQFKKDFQTGKRDILLFTMRSGGVGISLHHDRVTTKPRHIILPPTWSAIDLAQALGRVHRLTTISETTQEVLWYAETREQDVKVRVELKLQCIAKAIVAKEQFVDTFMKAIGEEIDADELASAEEQARHIDEPNDKDDTDSKDEEDSITGEGLENE